MQSAKTVLASSAFLLALARPGLMMAEPPQEGPSLADFARQERSERAKAAKKPVKVFTNDDFPARPPEASPGVAGGADTKSGGQEASPGGSAAPASSKEDSYRKAMNDLRAKLETHQRQLQVLQQKLAQNQMQYYADPNKTLAQEFTREDVNKITQDIQAKRQEIEADQKAIEDFQDRLRREGADPGFVRELMNAPVQPVAAVSVTEPAANPTAENEANPEDKKKTKEYWQTQFKAARDQVAKAEEQQKLTEDELSLLRIQQARELDSRVQNEVSQKITAKTPELEAARAVTAKAQKALDAVEAAFKQSGAPAEWRP